MTYKPLAAIRFDTEDVDGFVAGLVGDLRAAGWRLSGVIQSRGVADAECHCADMDLTSISTGEVFRISQPLGNGSRGCRLHPGALAQCSAQLERELHGEVDLLVLNRFGRGESEGRGFRDLIARAGSETPMVIGVTGSYCAGKNIVTELIQTFGFSVIDEDRVGHEALAAKSAEIVAAFGPAVHSAEGGIDRRRLGAVVFADEEQLALLESIVHPWMIERTRQRVESAEPRRVVINAAILFKMGLHRLCDFVIIVRAPLPVRLVRAMRRDSLSFLQVTRRFRRQRALNRAPKNVDSTTVWNVGSREALARRVFRILKRKGMVER